MTRPVLVFLHGTMCDSRLFAPQISHFSGAWDIRTPEVEWREGGLAGLVADMLSHLPPKFAVVGLSLGGIVALEMLRQAAGRLSHVALLDTNDGEDTESGRAKREEDFARAQHEGLENFMRREMIPRYLHEDNLRREDLADTVAKMALDCGAAKWRGQLDLLETRQNARGLPARTGVPLLVACGEHDRICPPALHRDMARAAGVRAKIFPSCGHLPTLESPQRVNDALARLLSA